MAEKVKPKSPEIILASEPWVLEKNMDTENRIEKAFHDQTKFLIAQQSVTDSKLESLTRWMIGLMVTISIAILVAVISGAVGLNAGN